jgi:DNA-binding NtrC family response regulator
MHHILVIDDESSIRRALKDIFEYEGFHFSEAADGKAGLKLLKEDEIDVVLCDIKMPKMDGMEFLDEVRKISSDIPVIMITGHGNEDTAFDAAKKGAYDFIQKPLDLNRVLITVRNAVDKSDLVAETKSLKRRVDKVQEIIGESPSVKKIKDTIEKVARTDARVLVTGENGTGKELVGRWLHEKSTRANGPLVEVNCAAIPSELVESELFGHEKGAFTSAHKNRIGKFEQANGGSIFLDEIGDMSMDAQAKMLRVLQENKLTRVGGEKEINIDVRVIAATNKDLTKLVEKGEFRLDLYHRLGVIIIHVPSLNERKDDIPLLAERFLKDVCDDYNISKKQITPKGMYELQKINWTGNVRELRNVIERLVILSEEKITEEDVRNFVIPKDGASISAASLEGVFNKFSKFHEFKEFVEKSFIEYKLNKNVWNVSRTAEELAIQRSHLYNKIEKFNLERV